MNVHIQSSGLEITPGIKSRLTRRVERDLKRYDGDLMTVDAYLSDINGPRGGTDKKVIMRASLRGLPPVSITTRHDDLYVAIDRTAKRLRRAVKRSLGKSRTIQPRRVLRMRRLSREAVPG